MSTPNGSKFAFTVDVEDWYNSSRDLFAEADSSVPAVPHPSVVENTRSCLDILRSNGSRATFFILTTVCEHYPDLIRQIDAEGHEVAVHGYRHRLLYKMTPAEFRRDLETSLDLLAQVGIDRVQGFRAPYWSITKESLWVLDILQDFGFRYDSSIFPIRRGLYGIPDAPPHPHRVRDRLWEFPPATYRLLRWQIPIAGGGYLRLLPTWLQRPMVESLWKKGEVGVFYCHPYELDPQDVETQVQLRKPASLFYYLQQTLGRKDNPRRLRELMGRYRFRTIADLLDEMPESAT